MVKSQSLEGVSLVEAGIGDAQVMWNIQRTIFEENVTKYNNEKDPGNETLEEVIQVLKEGNQQAYKIMEGGVCKGIVWTVKEDEKKEEVRWLFKMGILAEYRGQGVAKRAIKELEKKHPRTLIWCLNVISAEKGARALYESVGYREMGYEVPFSIDTTLVYYSKSKIFF